MEWAAVTLQHGKFILTSLVQSLASPVHRRSSSEGPIPSSLTSTGSWYLESSQPCSPQAQLRGSYPAPLDLYKVLFLSSILPRGALEPDLFMLAFQGFLRTSIISYT